MRRALFAMVAISLAVYAGCAQPPDTSKQQRPAEQQGRDKEQRPAEKEGGIRVHTPGVDVEVGKGAKKKVDVEVHPNP